MPDVPRSPVADLEDALAVESSGLVARPLDVIGLIKPAAQEVSPAREMLWRRLFLEAPLPYWAQVTWSRKLTAEQLPALLAATTSTGWGFLSSQDTATSPSVADVLIEAAGRLDEFNPNLFPWDYGREGSDPPQKQKYLLGRELARCYLLERAGDAQSAARRVELLYERRDAWAEWIGLGAAIGASPLEVCEATALALDHVVSRGVTAGVDGVGRAHILLEHLSVDKSPAAAVVTAYPMPLGPRHQHLDGVIAPDLRENGILVIADEFLSGVANAWRYVRETTPLAGPTMLCFSVRPSIASVVQQLSGRSAEVAVLAAIESAVRRRMLRPDVAASAMLEIYSPTGASEDPRTEPASFEEKKNAAAINSGVSTVVLHQDVARQWRRRRESDGYAKPAAGPDVVASEFYRRDALPILETQSRWRLAYKIPGVITAAFVVMASLFWQLYKASASPIDAPLVDPNARLPLVTPLLAVSQMVTLALCVSIILQCHRSICRSLDNRRASRLALAICVAVVLLSQFLPIGVRYEGLLDTPVYSVLFGEPQVTASLVVRQGGGGFLALHALSQSAGFIAILYGASAFTIRLLQARAHSEPIFEDRCELIQKDWRFSLSLMRKFIALVVVFCLIRNTLWYYYLAVLPGVELIDNGGSLVSILAPLLGITFVLLISVSIVWLYVLNLYLCRVVATAQGRAGYTAADVVATLPRSARWLYAAKPIE